jgi:hypothetical protein
MENYSSIKKYEIMSFAGKWADLETIVLSKVKQAQKDKYHIFSLVCNLKQKIIIEHWYKKETAKVGELMREGRGKGESNEGNSGEYDRNTNYYIYMCVCIYV